MSVPPPGWYADPEVSGALRWWDGAQWAPSGAGAPAQQLATNTRRKLPRWMLIAGGVIALVVVARGGIPALLIVLGIAGAVVGLIALVRGGAPLMRLSGRKSAAIVAGIGVASIIVGGSAAGAINREASQITQFANTTASSPSSSPAPSPTPTPRETSKLVKEEAPIAFASTTVDDPAADLGATAIAVAGVAGVRTVTYRISLVDGVEVSRVVVSDLVTRAPVDEVVSNGTRQVPVPFVAAPAEDSGCHPSYADVCVPFASDVDCAGGSGNGPAYVAGPLRVVGHDEYKLDRDGDGIACD